MEMGRIMGKSIGSEHLGILQFWEFFCQPFGENTFSKNAPKTENEKLENIKFLSNQFTARNVYEFDYSGEYFGNSYSRYSSAYPCEYSSD